MHLFYYINYDIIFHEVVVLADILISWIILVGQIILIGLFLGLIKKTSGRILNNAGKYNVRSISAFIGTPIHEFGHYIFAKIFRFKVQDAQFFPSKIKDNGDGTVTLGFVRWSAPKYRITNSIGMLFIGIGPVITGTIVITMLTYFFEPDFFYSVQNKMIKQSFDLNFFENFYNTIKILIDSAIEQRVLGVKFIIYLILVSMIAIHMNLSAPDIMVSLMGLAEVTGIIGVISLISYYNNYLYIGVNKLIILISIISSAVLSLCFMCQCVYLIISAIRSEI